MANCLAPGASAGGSIYNDPFGATASGENGRDSSVSLPTLFHIVPGVIDATKCTSKAAHAVKQWVASLGNLPDVASLSAKGWLASVDAIFPATTYGQDDSRHVARLAVAVAFLCEKSRHKATMTSADLDFIWSIVREALTSKQPLGAAMRSSQGFFSVPLCSIPKDGNINELIRMHSWTLAGEGTVHPYIVEPTDDVDDATHARYAVSWTCEDKTKTEINEEETNGKKQEQSEVECRSKDEDAKGGNSTYKTHRIKSTVRNTGRYVQATAQPTETHGRDSSCSIPAAAYHWTEVGSDAFHATLFFFDASRGFVKDADVLGPKDAELCTTYRDPTGATPSELARKIELVRAWEELMEEGRAHARRAEWEQALKAFDKALTLCSSGSASAGGPDTGAFPNAARHRLLVQGELGSTNRRFGRYGQARDILEAAIAEMGTDRSSGPQHIEFSGELGVIYRHMGLLEEAKRTLQMQYDTARKHCFEKAACRAVGNLGMLNHQLAQQAQRTPNERRELLDTATRQLEERVERARRLKREAATPDDSSSTSLATLWESIGLQRLSVTYTAAGDTHRAVEAAEAAYALTAGSPDPTVAAMTRLFLGRALLRDGRREEGRAHLFGATLPAGRCTPAIALCKEPSAEHRAFLCELIDKAASSFSASFNKAESSSSSSSSSNSLRWSAHHQLELIMDAVDENGYTALDHCVFSGDAETEAVVVEALRRQLYERADRELAAKVAESQLRRGYRELFQEKLRLVLLQGGGSGSTSSAAEDDWRQSRIARLRHAYADALARSSYPSSWPPLKGNGNSNANVAQPYDEMFDVLKFVPYTDFETFGRLPNSRDGLVRRFVSPDSATSKPGIDGGGGGTSQVDFIIFVSYRWINKTPRATSPDDDEHTQYNRILAAIGAFLRLHPEVDKYRLGLWVDYACVDQSNPMPGISALPMIVTQCNAVISLIDSEYYERAWCCVEVMMVQTLRRAYGLHYWYEHVVDVQDEHMTRITDTAGSKTAVVKSFLREGPMEKEIAMAKKDLTFESDRPKILFLERQTKLLG